MTTFVAQQKSPLSADRAWQLLTAWPNHARHVPLTSISVTPPGPSAVRTVLLARTHLGPLSFDDPMEIVEWTPPKDGRAGRCRLVKQGRVILGWAELSVTPTASGSHATWTEEIAVAQMPRWTSPATGLFSHLLFTRVLRRLLEDDPGPTDTHQP